MIRPASASRRLVTSATASANSSAVQQLTPRTSSSRNTRSPTRSDSSWLESPTTTTRPACATRSIADRVTPGAPVASNTTSGPSSPAHSRAAATGSAPSASHDRLGTGSRPQLDAARHVVEEKNPARRGRSLLLRAPADRSGAEDDDPLAARDASARDRVNGDRHGLDDSAATAGSSSPTEKTCAAGRRSRSWSAPSRWMPIRLSSTQTFGATDRGRDSSDHMARAGQSATRSPPRSSGGQSGPTASTMPAASWPWMRGIRLRVRIVEIAEEEVEVRAAEADGLGSHDHLAGAGLVRVGDVANLHRRPWRW